MNDVFAEILWKPLPAASPMRDNLPETEDV
jgi:hypothetical protein